MNLVKMNQKLYNPDSPLLIDEVREWYFCSIMLKIQYKNLIVWKANIKLSSCLSLNVKIFFKINVLED